MIIQDVTSFVDYYTRLRARTMKVVACIPADRLGWAPAKGKWTIGDLARHLGAIERNMYGETIQGKPSTYTGCGRELADGFDVVVAYMAKCHEETLSILSALSDTDLQDKCITPGGHPITRWKWMRAMCEHEIHHRGQIYTYLGIMGVETPPLFGLTAEEVAAKAKVS